MARRTHEEQTTDELFRDKLMLLKQLQEAKERETALTNKVEKLQKELDFERAALSELRKAATS